MDTPQRSIPSTAIRPTIFLVDADCDDHESIRMLAHTLHVEAVVFESAEAFLSGYDGTPGCLVVDVDLPGMTGLELQEQLKCRGVALPVIVVASDSDVPLAVAAMQNGARDFIPKPFVERVLASRISDSLGI